MASGESITSTPVQVTTTGLPCYCDIDFYDTVEPITNVTFAGINNTSDAAIDGSPGLEDFKSLTPGEVVPGQSYYISVQGNTNDDYDSYFTVYIDFNRNGVLNDDGEVFEIAESIFNSTGTDGLTTGRDITIPQNVTGGPVVIRVVKLFDWNSSDPCSSSEGDGYGQAEDYVLNVLAETECNLVAPTAVATQSFCGEATLSDLEAQTPTGDVIWYAAEDATETINQNIPLVNGATYYAATSTDDCESTRTAITVAITIVPAISGETTQTFTVDTGLPITDIEVNTAQGATLSWYATTEAAEAGENALANEYVITENGTYYAVQTIGECRSEIYAVTVNVTLATTGFNKAAFSYYPNPVSGMLTLAYNNEMSNIEVFNLLGQKVLQSAAKATTATLDMGRLQAGTYLVKVTDTNSNTAIVKVIKQ